MSNTHKKAYTGGNRFEASAELDDLEFEEGDELEATEVVDSDLEETPSTFEDYQKSKEFQLQHEILALIKSKIGTSDKAKV